MASLTTRGLSVMFWAWSASFAGTALATTSSGHPNALLAAERSSPARVAAFAKLPDWRGFWEQFDIGASGTPDPDEVKKDTSGPAPVFNDAWLQQMKLVRQHNPATDRVCTFGFPTLLESSPLIFEIVSVPEETVMIFNMREVRHIYTDGAGHTPEDVRLTTPWGDSAGHWDGGTLDIETEGTNGLLRFHGDKSPLDSAVMSDKAVYHERMHMVDADTLEDSFTVTDPVALREPYKFTRRYHRIKAMTRVVEELDCETSGTNDRNPIVNGKWTVAPPKD